MLLLQNARVDERQHEAIRQRRAQLLHQIQRQRCAPRPVAVHKAHIRIQPDAFQRRRAVMRQQRIRHGERGVDPVPRRPSVSAVKMKNILLIQNHLVEHAEINRGPGAFQASEAV